MKPRNPDANQGEGDRISARHYNRKLRSYIATGQVDDALRAKDHTRVSVDELVAKGRTVVDRVKPIVERAAARLRSRLGRKDRENH